MRRVVARRVALGKDDPARAQEKLGQPSLARPAGPLVWVHAVGLGEVLALRPLLAKMGEMRPDVHFLVTSTARSSAQVFAQNLPPRVMHQFLPLDGPTFVAQFLDYWQPDVSIWSEQDLWPGIICDVARRDIPLAYINARLTEDGFAKRRRFRSGFAHLMRLFTYVAAQDARTVDFLQQLGAGDVHEMPSLKPAAEPLSVDAQALATVEEAVGARRVWVAASSHSPDEAVALAAQARVLEADPDALLIVVPRAPERGAEVCAALEAAGLQYGQRNSGQAVEETHHVYVADTLGELGLWYRVAQLALVGGSFGDTQGHNPWEAITLGCPVISGPMTDNFATDYVQLQDAGLARRVEKDVMAGENLATQVLRAGQEDTSQRAVALVAEARAAISPLAVQMLTLLSK
ncbi:3-deoxy-D-manno-octulosonic acid transferase [Shimia sp. MIT1388]|uniref:3-deoxy-D-manno-octulosonic acid transferase n=1 Tax=Shimia sp. MIT1388 TaxID=3096992 RepID=UPI00399B3B55